MLQIWFELVQTATCYTSKQQLMACLHLDKHFLLHFSMKHHWITNKSKSKTPSTLGQNIGPSTEIECDRGPINQPSDQKGLKVQDTE